VAFLFGIVVTIMLLAGMGNLALVEPGRFSAERCHHWLNHFRRTDSGVRKCAALKPMAEHLSYAALTIADKPEAAVLGHPTKTIRETDVPHVSGVVPGGYCRAPAFKGCILRALEGVSRMLWSSLSPASLGWPARDKYSVQATRCEKRFRTNLICATFMQSTACEEH
jgi:hypothetical protein